MTTFLKLFYRFPLDTIARCFFLISLVFLWVRHRYGHCRWFRRGLWITLTLWAAAALWTTVLSRTPGQVHPPELIPFHSYRELLVTSVREIGRTNFMNVALFYPAGLFAASLLPREWSHGRMLLLVGILFVMFSLSIECAQFFYELGEPEIDDVIHNVLGAMLGTLPILFRRRLHDPAN